MLALTVQLQLDIFFCLPPPPPSFYPGYNTSILPIEVHRINVLVTHTSTQCESLKSKFGSMSCSIFLIFIFSTLTVGTNVGDNHDDEQVHTHDDNDKHTRTHDDGHVRKMTKMTGSTHAQ